MQNLPIFVYGSLLPGLGNHRLLQGRVERQEYAKMQGDMYSLGAFPMVVEGGGWVHGLIMTICDDVYDQTLFNLDRLEGFDPDNPDQGFYRRVKRTFFTEDQTLARFRGQDVEPITAWVYVGTPDKVNGRKPVPGGDWKAFVGRNGNG